MGLGYQGRGLPAAQHRRGVHGVQRRVRPAAGRARGGAATGGAEADAGEAAGEALARLGRGGMADQDQAGHPGEPTRPAAAPRAVAWGRADRPHRVPAHRGGPAAPGHPGAGGGGRGGRRRPGGRPSRGPPSGAAGGGPPGGDRPARRGTCGSTGRPCGASPRRCPRRRRPTRSCSTGRGRPRRPGSWPSSSRGPACVSLPTGHAKRRLVLERLVQEFEPGLRYDRARGELHPAGLLPGPHHPAPLPGGRGPPDPGRGGLLAHRADGSRRRRRMGQ